MSLVLESLHPVGQVDELDGDADGHVQHEAHIVHASEVGLKDSSKSDEETEDADVEQQGHSDIEQEHQAAADDDALDDEHVVPPSDECGSVGHDATAVAITTATVDITSITDHIGVITNIELLLLCCSCCW